MSLGCRHLFLERAFGAQAFISGMSAFGRQAFIPGMSAFGRQAFISAFGLQAFLSRGLYYKAGAVAPVALATATEARGYWWMVGGRTSLNWHFF